MKPFGLYAHIKTQAGQRDALVAVLLEAAAVLQQVPGCQLSLVTVSAIEPDTVWVTEVWRSQAEHEASSPLRTSSRSSCVAGP